MSRSIMYRRRKEISVACGEKDSSGSPALSTCSCRTEVTARLRQIPDRLLTETVAQPSFQGNVERSFRATCRSSGRVRPVPPVLHLGSRPLSRPPFPYEKHV